MEDVTVTPAPENTVNQDKLNHQQQWNIEEKISESILLIGKKESLNYLGREYAEDQVYLSKAEVLAEIYSFIRVAIRTRSDYNFFENFHGIFMEVIDKLDGDPEI